MFAPRIAKIPAKPPTGPPKQAPQHRTLTASHHGSDKPALVLQHQETAGLPAPPLDFSRIPRSAPDRRDRSALSLGGWSRPAGPNAAVAIDKSYVENGPAANTL